MIEKFLDPYELKARDVPGLILVFPILIDALYAVPVLGSWPIFAASGICGFALIYALGHLSRAQGERIESSLWASWCGPPSTRFMRHRDAFFGKTLKRLIYEKVEKNLSIRLATEDEEANNPSCADKQIEDAFRRIREYLRKEDPGGLWYHHNIEYGFSRNLLGSRLSWAIVAAGASVFAALHGMRTGHGPANPASVMNLLAFIGAVYIGWAVLPGATKRIADAYAESAWTAFLRLTQESTIAARSPIQDFGIRSG